MDTHPDLNSSQKKASSNSFLTLLSQIFFLLNLSAPNLHQFFVAMAFLELQIIYPLGFLPTSCAFIQDISPVCLLNELYVLKDDLTLLNGLYMQ